MRNTVKVLTDQWEKWNTLFITSLEPRIASTASTLSSIDSNIHNLQERAHVWDTFQLHVTAWNDQLATMDRKIDILKKAVEQISSMDSKINSLLSEDFKLDKVVKMVNSLLDVTANIETGVKSKQFCSKPAKDSLFEEFAARGILSSLKLVERKVDQLFSTRQCDHSRSDEVPRPSSKSMEVLIGDISSKVDVIFDSVAKTNEVDYAEDYVESIRDLEGSGAAHKIQNRKRSPALSCKLSVRDLEERMRGMENKIDNLIAEGRSRMQQEDMVRLMDLWAKTVSANQTRNLQLLLDSYFAAPDSKFIATTEATATTKRTTLTSTHKSSSCNELKAHSPSGSYTFFNNRRDLLYERFFNRQFCELRNGTLWTVIQRRDNYTIQQDFNVSWYDYKLGFGDLRKDFWMGNNFLSRFSQSRDLTLRIELEDFEGNTAWAQYEDFRVAGEDEGYQLTIGAYVGNASDSFSSHNGSRFSTYDKKNDLAPDCCSCSISYGGGWWFNRCFEANLNGVYYRNPTENKHFKGVIWELWLGNYSLKKSLMMVKVKEVNKGFSDVEDP
ncbi:angiopoietin-related protein 7-like isoform X2 [Euwallacea fornicatus]